MKYFKVPYFENFLHYPVIEFTGKRNGDWLEIVTELQGKNRTTWIKEDSILFEKGQFVKIKHSVITDYDGTSLNGRLAKIKHVYNNDQYEVVYAPKFDMPIRLGHCHLKADDSPTFIIKELPC